LAHVLLDEEDREALAVQPADQREHLVHEQRREAERGLVEDEQPRLGHQPAADREHLLLAAGERSRALGGALLEAREDGEHALEALRAARTAAPIAAELEVLEHREIREDAAPFGHLDQAGRHDVRIASAGDVRALEADRAAEGGVQAAHRVVQGRLAGAVRAEHRDDLAGVDAHADAAQHFDSSITSAKAVDLEKRAHVYAVPCARRRRSAVPWPR